jgi:hypothetical protein
MYQIIWRAYWTVDLARIEEKEGIYFTAFDEHITIFANNNICMIWSKLAEI